MLMTLAVLLALLALLLVGCLVALVWNGIGLALEVCRDRYRGLREARATSS